MILAILKQAESFYFNTSNVNIQFPTSGFKCWLIHFNTSNVNIQSTLSVMKNKTLVFQYI